MGMMTFWKSGTLLAFLALPLGACGEGNSNGADVTDETLVSTVINSELTIDFHDGSMASVNGCIERNNTDHLEGQAVRTACAWAHSVPFAGKPPGIQGYMAYEWPNIIITVENQSRMLLLTEVCITMQFDPTHILNDACGSVIASPMSMGPSTINIRNALDQFGFDASYELNPATVAWDISSVRYIRILEPVPQEQE